MSNEPTPPSTPPSAHFSDFPSTSFSLHNKHAGIPAIPLFPPIKSVPKNWPFNQPTPERFRTGWRKEFYGQGAPGKFPKRETRDVFASNNRGSSSRGGRDYDSELGPLPPTPAYSFEGDRNGTSYQLQIHTTENPTRRLWDGPSTPGPSPQSPPGRYSPSATSAYRSSSYNHRSSAWETERSLPPAPPTLPPKPPVATISPRLNPSLPSKRTHSLSPQHLSNNPPKRTNLGSNSRASRSDSPPALGFGFLGSPSSNYSGHSGSGEFYYHQEALPLLDTYIPPTSPIFQVSSMSPQEMADQQQPIGLTYPESVSHQSLPLFHPNSPGDLVGNSYLRTSLNENDPAFRRETSGLVYYSGDADDEMTDLDTYTFDSVEQWRGWRGSGVLPRRS